MKRIMISISFILLIMSGQFVFAKTGQLFNVRIAIFDIITSNNNGGIPLTINTTIPGKLYQAAGIKINTPGISILRPGIDCTPSGNGYCLFAVSDSAPANIVVSFPNTYGIHNRLFAIPNVILNMTLCLNGMGSTFSCENQTIRLNPQV